MAPPLPQHVVEDRVSARLEDVAVDPVNHRVQPLNRVDQGVLVIFNQKAPPREELIQ